jgi:hypothetical protein
VLIRERPTPLGEGRLIWMVTFILALALASTVVLKPSHKGGSTIQRCDNTLKRVCLRDRRKGPVACATCLQSYRWILHNDPSVMLTSGCDLKWTQLWCNQTSWTHLAASETRKRYMLNLAKKMVVQATKQPTYSPSMAPTKAAIQEMHDLLAQGLDYQCETWKRQATDQCNAPQGPQCIKCLLLARKTPLQRLCYRHSARDLCSPQCHQNELEAACGKDAKGRVCIHTQKSTHTCLTQPCPFLRPPTHHTPEGPPCELCVQMYVQLRRPNWRCFQQQHRSFCRGLF